MQTVDNSDHAVGKSLFVAVKLVKNADIDKYKCFGCGTGFDMKEIFFHMKENSLLVDLVKM